MKDRERERDAEERSGSAPYLVTRGRPLRVRRQEREREKERERERERELSASHMVAQQAFPLVLSRAQLYWDLRRAKIKLGYIVLPAESREEPACERVGVYLCKRGSVRYKSQRDRKKEKSEELESGTSP